MMFSCLMIVLCVTLETLAAEPPMFSDSKSKMTGDGKFKVYWMYNKSMDAVWFKVEAKVTGYVAFGVSAPGATGMNKYDMAVGGVRQNGTAYLEDYLTQAYSRPPRDASNNLKLYNATEKDGMTTLIYYRKRDTGDTAGDIVIAYKMDLKYAYKNTVDDPAASGNIAKHDSQGTWAGINLLPEDMMSTMKPSTPMIKFENSQMRSVDGGNLKYYWMTKDGMIWFKVIAKAKGWVALGVTKERSTDMKGFDVAVGGMGGGGSYLGDYFTIGKQQPKMDAKQDVTLDMAEQKDDYTTLMFHRKLKTGDSEYDVNIEPGDMNIVWAYHATSDVSSGSFGGKHTERGYDKASLVQTSGQVLVIPSVLLVLGLATYQFFGF